MMKTICPALLMLLILSGCHSTSKNPPKAIANKLSIQSIDRRIAPQANEPRMLYVLLKLRPDTVAVDTDIVAALRSLRWFSDVILVVPSWQEKPNASEHHLVREVVAICKRKGIGLWWGRWLWVAWAPRGSKSTVGAEYDPIHYSTALLTVNTEALALGAKGSFFDAEPYGKSPQRQSLKRKHLTAADRARIKQAIFDATSIVGYVDMIYPTSSSDTPWHFAWSMDDLAVLRCDAKTYWAKAPDYKLPRIMRPEGFTHRIDYWGSIVGVVQRRATGDVILTPRDVMALDLKVIRKTHPNCKGFWVFVPHKQLADTIRNWTA